jgi:hypothetical protein
MPLDAGQGLIQDTHAPMGAASMAHAYGLSSPNTMPPIQNALTAIAMSLSRDPRTDAERFEALISQNDKRAA